MAVAPWFDHHDDASLDARYATDLEGSTESITEASGLVTFDAGASSGAGIWYYDEKLPTATGWLLRWAMRTSHTNFDLGFLLLDETGGPTVGTNAQLAGKAVAKVTGGGGAEIEIRRWDSGGTSEYWDGSTWTTTSSRTGVAWKADSMMMFYIENDGANEQWRIGILSEPPGTDTNRGERLVLLTDWIAWSDSQNTGADPYLCWGGASTQVTQADRTCEIDFAQFFTGARTYGYANAATAPSGAYELYLSWMYGDWDTPGGPWFVPEDIADSPILALGAGGSWDDANIRGKSVSSDGAGTPTYYMAYGASDGADRAIGIASASDPEGAWTKYGSNPVIDPASNVQFPWMIYDPDNNGRWYIFLVEGGEIHVWSTSNSTPLTTSWTDHGLILDHGSGADWDADQVNNPVVWFNESQGYWEMLYAGAQTVGGQTVWGFGHAKNSGTDPTTGWTKSGELVAWDAEPDTSLTAGTTDDVTLTVTASGSFDLDQPCVLTDDALASSGLIVRVRRKPSSTQIETYEACTISSAGRIQGIGRGGHYATGLVKFGGTYYLIGTNFREYVGDDPATELFSSEKGAYLGSTTDLSVAPTRERLSDHIVPLPDATWGERSNENFTSIVDPVAADASGGGGSLEDAVARGVGRGVMRGAA